MHEHRLSMLAPLVVAMSTLHLGVQVTLKEVWKPMINGTIEGTRVTFDMLLDGFAKQGQCIEARDVVSGFGKIGL
ncbi:hypothetical protein V6N11_028816 [Hibiscus sabdariffa]|uniref:Uncharacterized protein n=1 Tax=Hibiscus sabdariffa TaxID=183260 RepID=A0ABR2PQY4_9ROSI